MTGWAVVTGLWRGLWRGGVLGAGVVTLFAFGTLIGQPGVGVGTALVQALVWGGLLVGLPLGAFCGALVAAVRIARRRKAWERGRAPLTSADRALTPSGAPVPRLLREALDSPDYGPGSPEDRALEAAAPRGYQPPYSRPVGLAPVPLAAISAAPARPVRPAVSMQDPQRLNRVLQDLDGLPGLEVVAERVRGMARRLVVDEQRKAEGLRTAEVGLHLVFTGPAGTGKTTVARSWGKVLAAVGLLPSGHVVEVDRSDLVGQTVGATGPQTLAKIAEAEGGVLFIDEAYTLTPTNPSQDFGAEAVAALLRAMEDRRGRFAAVVAGYEADMNRFLESNSGLAGRFAHTLRFPAYDAEALLAVAQKMAGDADYRWAPEAEAVLLKAFTRLAAVPPQGWANARSVRSLLDAAVDAQAARLHGSRPCREALSTLGEGDALEGLLARYPHLFG